MSGLAARPCQALDSAEWTDQALGAAADCLARLGAEARVEWALAHLPGRPILSSSFGAQSAVMLHLMTRRQPDIPVVFIDTGYLFAETYQFVDQLCERLRLNLKVYRPALSGAWQEARSGQLWEQGAEGIRRYNEVNKQRPMARALTELDAGLWFSGVRRAQSASRRQAPLLQRHEQVIKIYPVVDWDNRQVHRYLKTHQLPYHPLWDQGYVSIGDVHSTRPLSAGMLEEETRFSGLVRECGLHDFG